MSRLLRVPYGQRDPVQKRPLGPRLKALAGARLLVFHSWREGSLFDGSFQTRLIDSLSRQGATVAVHYKRLAFDQDDPREREALSRDCDAVLYVGASSCSTSKFAVVYGGHWDSQCQRPVVVLTYQAFDADCQQAKEDAGTPTRVVLSDYPGDEISDAALQDLIQALVQGWTQALSETESATGWHHFSVPDDPVSVPDPHEWLYRQHLTDGQPVRLPTPERVDEMLQGTSLPPDQCVATRVWPSESSASVETVAKVAVMAGLPPAAMPLCCALARAYSDCPGQALVVSTNSFALMPVLSGRWVRQLALNHEEHAMSAVPGHLNAALGRFLHLLQISVGGWRPGVNALGVMGNPLLGSPLVAQDPAYGDPEDSGTLSLFAGGWSMWGNYMNRPLEHLMDQARYCDYPVGVLLLISPLRADRLIAEHGSLDAAAAHLRAHAQITLAQFWEQDWTPVFTRPQLEHGAAPGELGGYSEQYLRYFEDPQRWGSEQVSAFPQGGIHFVVTGGRGSPMVRAVHGAPVARVTVDNFR